MADDQKDNPPVEDEKSEKLPPLEGEGNEENKVDDEPPTRQPKEKPVDKEANRLGFELRKRDEAIRKLNEKITNLEANNGGGEGDDDKPDDDVAEKLSRFEEKLQKLESEKALESDIQGVISKNPDYKKFEGTLRKYAANDAYKNVPIDFIADGLAKRYREADTEVDEKKAGGNTKRRLPSKKSVWDMSKDEFEQHQADVLGQR